MANVNRQWLLAARPEGMVKASDFKFNEAPMPQAGDGEVLLKVLYVSVEPAMRGQMVNRSDYVAPLEIGDVMRAAGTAQVVESNNPDFQVGDLVQTTVGFQEYLVSDGKTPQLMKMRSDVPIEAAMSVFGGTGFTGYHGMMNIGEPKAGDQVLVSGAAGGVGVVASQCAKIQGARVVGLAGSDEKCKFLTEELGLDAAINYKTEDVAARVDELFPQGLDIYFDNVGGDILDMALGRIKIGARVVLCGGISRYNKEGRIPGPENYFNLIFRRAKMQGYIIIDHTDKFADWAETMTPWINAGQLIYQVDVVEGFENLPVGLIRLFEGKNIGKQLIKLADPQ